jgi:hypothetical protein
MTGGHGAVEGSAAGRRLADGRTGGSRGLAAGLTTLALVAVWGAIMTWDVSGLPQRSAHVIVGAMLAELLLVPVTCWLPGAAARVAGAAAATARRLPA